MEDRKLTGNKMFEMVKEECERVLGRTGILYIGVRNSEFGFYKEKWKGVISITNEDFSRYVGEINNGKPNGQGTETYTNGSKYVGGWKDGKPHGQGRYTNSPQSNEYKYVYVGEWKNGKKNGKGTYTGSNGGKYVGEFKDGDFWNGTTYDKNGNIIGKWVNGKWIPN